MDLQLNPEQQRAATHLDGPCLVTAGPGTGKTKTLTARAHYLVRGGAAPSSIILMTFTKKAANEIRERLKSIDPVYGGVRTGTFHSIAIDIIRKYGKMPALSIIDDEEDAAELHRYCVDRLKPEKDAMPASDMLHAAYSMRPHKNKDICLGFASQIYGEFFESEPGEAMDPDEAIEAEKQFLERFRKVYKESIDFCDDEPLSVLNTIFRAYDKRKRAIGTLSFDDCILVGTEILDGPAGNLIRSGIGYVCVDEFQDSNEDQILFVNALCRHNRNIFAVGDDKQSIYCWRGAYPKVFDDFRAFWKPVEISLVKNYRSTSDIIDAVNAAAQARPRDSDMLEPTRSQGKRPAFLPCGGVTAEDVKYRQADMVFDLIQKCPNPDSAAVLFRSHRFGVSGLVQAKLIEARISFRMVGGQAFTDYVVFKHFKALMRILDNPGWALPWIRLLRCFSGIGEVAAAKTAHFVSNASTPQEALKNLGILARDEKGKKLQGGLQEALGFFYPMRNMDSKTKPMEVMDKFMGTLMILSSGIAMRDVPDKADWRELIKKGKMAFIDDAPVKTHKQVIEIIASICERHSTPAAWLDAVNIDDTTEEDPKGVVLSTIHGAKGKEWDTVICPEMQEEVLPSAKVAQFVTESEKGDREADGYESVEYTEERNLFYVAISRAKKELYLLAPVDKQSVFVQDLLHASAVDVREDGFAHMKRNMQFAVPGGAR